MIKAPDKNVIQAWIQLHRVHRKLMDKVENALKSRALASLDWYDVLLELNKQNDEGLRQYEISEKVLLNKHNLSRLIDRLEKSQLVARYECEEDARGNRIKISTKGKKLLKQIWPVYSNSIQENFGAKLTSNEFNELSRLMTKLLGNNNE